MNADRSCLLVLAYMAATGLLVAGIVLWLAESLLRALAL